MTDWKDLCTDLGFVKANSEMDYQKSLCHFLLKKALGWKEENIKEQPSYTIGSTNRIIPDVVISKEGKYQFIIEVKAPNHIQQARNLEQLVSYMKLLEVPVGLYIGEFIEVIYKEHGKDAQSIIKIKFNHNDHNGKVFLELFQADTFSSEIIKELYAEIIRNRKSKEKVKETIKELVSEKGYDLLRNLLQLHLIDSGFSENEINEINENIKITVTESTEAESGNTKKWESTEDKSTKMVQKHIKPIGRKMKVQDFGYELIENIVTLHKDKRYDELKNVFVNLETGRPNSSYIRRKEDIKDKSRWFMDYPHWSSDGIEYYITNQWGKTRTKLPHYNNAKNLAKKYGIDADELEIRFFSETVR